MLTRPPYQADDVLLNARLNPHLPHDVATFAESCRIANLLEAHGFEVVGVFDEVYLRGAGDTWLDLLMERIADDRIDAVDRRVRMAPVRVPMTVPLLYFADWKDGRVPLVSFAIKDGVVTHSVTHGDLLAGFELSIESIKD